MAHDPWARLRRFLCLAALALVNSALILSMRWSRITRAELYQPASVVVAGEVVKFATSLLLEVLGQRQNAVAVLHHLVLDLFHNPAFALGLLVPSALYAVQNNLCFIALSNLPVVNYQTLHQLKILTTALFSVLLLAKRLSLTQWASLGLLVVGAILVQSRAQPLQPPSDNHVLGLLAILAASLSSGFAGVYFERLAKSDPTRSLWLQSMEVSVLGFLFSLLIWVRDGHLDAFFSGWNALTLAILLLQAASGILVAVVIRHTDNILKGFATSASIVISSIGTYVWIGERPTPALLLGALLVILAAGFYATAELETRRSSLAATHSSY